MRALKNVFVDGILTDVTVDGGKIISIGTSDAPGIDLGGKKLYPGLIDTHIHGCAGCDTMDEENTLGKMADFLLSHGTTSFYPTTMTASYEDIIRTTHKDVDIGHGANILGFHLEGPFINPKFKGAQNAAHIFKPDLALLSACRNVAQVTLAPELPGSKRFIESCGTVTSLGHSDADYDTAKGAFRTGLTCLTHSFNAMQGIHHRAPGPLVAAMETEGVFAELIADGKHIHPAVMRMFIKMMGEDRVVLVSDALSVLGMPDGEAQLGGLTINVTGGTAYTKDGHLAGSTATLFDCVRVLIGCGISEAAAIKMASENPARMMGLKKGKIEVGYDADFIVVDDDFNLVMSIARGEF